jgi:hypothetical protein
MASESQLFPHSKYSPVGPYVRFRVGRGQPPGLLPSGREACRTDFSRSRIPLRWLYRGSSWRGREPEGRGSRTGTFDTRHDHDGKAANIVQGGAWSTFAELEPDPECLPRCVECHRESASDIGVWRAYLTDDEDESDRGTRLLPGVRHARARRSTRWRIGYAVEDVS